MGDGSEFNTQTLSAAMTMLDEVKIRLAALKQKLASKKDSSVV